jgi:hypothetical protein
MKFNPFICIAITAFTAFVLASCSAGNELTKKRYGKVKNPPSEKPFVYYNKINILNLSLDKEKKIDPYFRLNHTTGRQYAGACKRELAYF